MNRSAAPRLHTVRLIIHTPPEGRALAHWTLMLVAEGGQVPSAEVLASGNIPCSGSTPAYEEILTMIDGIVGPQLIA